MRLILLLAILLISGCNAPPVAPVVLPPVAPPKSVSEVIRDLELKNALTAAEAVDLEIRLSESQNDLVIERGNAQAANNAAAAAENARIALEAAEAAREGMMSWVLMGLGTSGIVLGIVWIVWKHELKLGLGIVAGGFVLLFTGTNLAAFDRIIRWSLASVAAIGIGSLLAWRIGKFRIWWLTEKQKNNKLAAAVVATNEGKPIEAAVLTAEASVLHHVGTTDFDATVVKPSEEAVKLIEKIP